MQATTPRKTRSKRNGSSSSGGSTSSSQRYTAYLRERNSISSSVDSLRKNPFSREEEIYGQLKLRLTNSQPTINNIQDDYIDNFSTNQSDLSPPIDRDIGNFQQQQNDNNNNPPSSYLRDGFNFLIGIIEIPIFFIFKLIKGLSNLWNKLDFKFPDLTTTTPTAISTSTTITNNNIISRKSDNNKWLIYLLLFVIIILFLSSLKFGDDDKTLADYIPDNVKVRFWSLDGSTYKIEPIKENISSGNGNKNDSVVLTLEDLRKVIINEVRNHLKAEKAENEKRLPSLSDEPMKRLRDIINEEIKQVTLEVRNMVSAEVKKSRRPIPSSVSRMKKTKDELTLEIIRTEARKVVKDELLVFSQDKIMKPDFALYSSGARVLPKFTSRTYERWPDKWYKRTLAYFGNGVIRGKPPVTAIKPDTNVGECWPFPGQEGQLAILLNRRVYVTAVTYDHVSRDVAVEVASAPKEFEVWGLVDDGTNSSESNIDIDIEEQEDFYDESTEEKCGKTEEGQFISGKNNKHAPQSLSGLGSGDLDPLPDNVTEGELGSRQSHLFLGYYTYNISGLPVQTFDVPQEVQSLRKPVRTIIMKVLSNWGKSEYTCLYRFRVHGNPVDKQK